MPKIKSYKNGHLKKKAMVAALKSTLGIVTHACTKLDIRPQQHYDWLKKDPSYAKAVEELEDDSLDFAESQLFEQMKSGSTAATIFYLKCKGKARGYLEKTQIDHTTGGKPLQSAIQIEIVDPTDD